MAVAKDIITNVLRTSLLRFIKDASGDQLHLRHLLSGTVELGPDVALAEQAIQQVLLDIGFPASIEVLSAHADSIRVHIPWAKLLGQSTRLVMGELTVQVRIHNVESMAQVLEGKATNPPKVEHAFLSRQRERLEAMVQKRCSKPPEGVVRRLTLLETVIQGLRAHVNKMRLEIFRDVDGYEASPSSMPFLTMELQGFTVSPCTNAKRPTLELAEARAVIDMAGSLVDPLTPYAFRRLFRMDSAEAWVAKRGGDGREGQLPCYDRAKLPWQRREEAMWCSVVRFGACCLRTNIYQASIRSRARSLGAYIVEEGGALLGMEKILDMEPPDDLHRKPSLDVDMEAAMALELAELGGHFFSGFGVSNDWRTRQVERRLPAIVGLPLTRSTSGSLVAPPRVVSTPPQLEEEEEEVEPVKEAVDSFLREGFRAERRSSLERRSSADGSSAGADKGKKWLPGEKILMSGWLTKRAKLRPFQDSWQERWCELSQLPKGHGLLRYSAPSGGFTSGERPGEVQLKGEIQLAPHSGAHVTSFEDELGRLRGATRQASYFDWSRHAWRIMEEFQHGFALQTGPEAPHAGRVFFFATERDSETRRWVAAIRGVLAETAEKPQTLEEFLGEGFTPSAVSPGSTCLDEKDISEGATEDISEDESSCSFVSVEEELGPERPRDPPQDLGATSVEALEAMLSRVKQFQSMKVNMASLRVRIGFDSIANPLKGILDEKIPKHMALHASLGNLQLTIASQSQRRGASVAPLAKLMGTVPDSLVEELLQRRASWSTLSTAEMTVGEVNIKRPDLNRCIALGQRPHTSHIRLFFEERTEKEAGEELTKSGTLFSGSLVQLSACVDVPVLMTLQVFLVKLGKAFAPAIPTLTPPPPPGEEPDPVAVVKAMAPVSFQMRLEGLEVEVPLPGMPLSGHGLRISIGQMQFSSLEALQSFAASISRQASSLSSP